ncbi:hypothetical protein BESB_008900 [Besnoitia besnoiti]|uniref:Uncharacterized protein n=1 Tax=Besnoitia besnoiti TaxID=94643 RepID=A0A2A9MJ28_BESBE|nr:hypothetical protein BESB_008900 [Besnoitia besnoiti]PFH38548.1 hypothetical protein BESB_008900 [Besnoitia besnoiti]
MPPSQGVVQPWQGGIKPARADEVLVLLTTTAADTRAQGCRKSNCLAEEPMPSAGTGAHACAPSPRFRWRRFLRSRLSRGNTLALLRVCGVESPPRPADQVAFRPSTASVFALGNPHYARSSPDGVARRVEPARRLPRDSNIGTSGTSSADAGQSFIGEEVYAASTKETVVARRCDDVHRNVVASLPAWDSDSRGYGDGPCVLWVTAGGTSERLEVASIDELTDEEHSSISRNDQKTSTMLNKGSLTAMHPGQRHEGCARPAHGGQTSLSAISPGPRSRCIEIGTKQNLSPMGVTHNSTGTLFLSTLESAVASTAWPNCEISLRSQYHSGAAGSWFARTPRADAKSPDVVAVSSRSCLNVHGRGDLQQFPEQGCSSLGKQQLHVEGGSVFVPSRGMLASTAGTNRSYRKGKWSFATRLFLFSLRKWKGRDDLVGAPSASIWNHRDTQRVTNAPRSLEKPDTCGSRPFVWGTCLSSSCSDEVTATQHGGRTGNECGKSVPHPEEEDSNPIVCSRNEMPDSRAPTHIPAKRSLESNLHLKSHIAVSGDAQTFCRIVDTPQMRDQRRRGTAEGPGICDNVDTWCNSTNYGEVHCCSSTERKPAAGVRIVSPASLPPAVVSREESAASPRAAQAETESLRCAGLCVASCSRHEEEVATSTDEGTSCRESISETASDARVGEDFLQPDSVDHLRSLQLLPTESSGHDQMAEEGSIGHSLPEEGSVLSCVSPVDYWDTIEVDLYVAPTLHVLRHHRSHTGDHEKCASVPVGSLMSNKCSCNDVGWCTRKSLTASGGGLRYLDSDLLVVKLKQSSLMVQDDDGLLHLDVMPSFEGCLFVTNLGLSRKSFSKYSRLLRPLPFRRFLFFVLSQGHLFWFRSSRDFVTRGFSAAIGSISLIINQCRVEVTESSPAVPGGQFLLEFHEWGRTIEFRAGACGGGKRKRRSRAEAENSKGAWVQQLLATIQKGEQIRESFRNVDWAQTQRHAMLVAERFGVV